MSHTERAATPDCLACGTCCFSDLREYVRVWSVDHDRMDARAREFTHVVGTQRYMRLRDGHCAALQIDPVARRFTCAIYLDRPDACRALERGSRSCREDLRDKADRPLIAVETLLRRAASQAER